MELILVLYLLTYAVLPMGLGLLHFRHLRLLWGILFFVSGAFTGVMLLGWVLMGKLGFAVWMSFLAVLSAGIHRRVSLKKTERVGHAIFGTATVCMTAVMLFDRFNIRIPRLTDDSTGLIVGIVLAALLFRGRR